MEGARIPSIAPPTPPGVSVNGDLSLTDHDAPNILFAPPLSTVDHGDTNMQFNFTNDLWAFDDEIMSRFNPDEPSYVEPFAVIAAAPEATLRSPPATELASTLSSASPGIDWPELKIVSPA